MKTKVIVIGAGPSGLMAAIQAAEADASVTVLERAQKPGRKILVSGNGRCNFTNLTRSEHSYRGSDPSFAEPALKRFPPSELIRFFRTAGVMEQEREGWVYPYSDQAKTVLRALLRRAERCGVRIKCSERVTDIRKEEQTFLVSSDGWTYESDSVILACGSCASYPAGEGRDGYALAERLGHSVVPLHPALTYLVTSHPFARTWSGVRVRGRISFRRPDGRELSRTGQLQLIEGGISGIPVFQISRYVTESLAEKRPAAIRMNLMPDLDEGDLTRFFEERKDPAQAGVNELPYGLFPEKLAALFARSADSPSALARLITSIDLPVTGAGSFANAQAAAGGISTAEIDPERMESRIVPGLYVTGELLDIDGDCGGYNLQWAFSSGYAAGRAAAGDPD